MTSTGTTEMFRKPGSTTNAVFNWGIPLAAISAIIYFFGGPIGDYIVNAFDNMLHLAIVGGILTFLGYAIFIDPKKRVWYLYRSLTRFLTSLFVDIDPIGILKSYQERMEGKLKEMVDALSSLKGQRLKTVKRQTENKAALDNEYHLMEQAQKHNDPSGLTIHGKQTTRLTAKAERYEGELNRLNLLITIMDRYHKLCEDTVTDMGNEIQYRIEEREEAKQSTKAVRGAMAILKGLPEKEMWDEATLTLERQYSQAIGEVENFLDMTKGILSTADLQDGADAEKAMQLLDAWQQKNSNVTLGGQGNTVTKADIINDAARQLTGAPSSINSKPRYTTNTVVVQQQASGGDDYLTLMK